jgi:hypothetical protein
VIVMIVVVVMVVVVVVMPVPGQLQDDKGQPGGDQDAADDRVLSALNGRAELQAHGDDHRAQDDRHQHVSHAGQP